MGNSSPESIQRRQYVIRTLLTRRIPKWELFKALQNVIITENGGKLQPYKYLNYKTFRRDLDAIRDEDREWFVTVASKTWEHEVRTAVNNIEHDIRLVREIASDLAAENRDRIAAAEKAMEGETLRLRLILDGQTVFAVQRNGPKEGTPKPTSELAQMKGQ